MTQTNTDPSTPYPAASGGRVTIAAFSEYSGAQRLVDQMSGDGFPVEYVRIVGNSLHTVENVTGRVTRSRAALAGAGSGAWFGVFFGLLFGLFATTGTGMVFILLNSAWIGALWGAVFGVVGHAATRDYRNFSSVQALQADHYEVQVEEHHADEASRFARRA